jgi:hypothetical protein
MNGVEILQTMAKDDAVYGRQFGGLMSIDRLYKHDHRSSPVFYICNTDLWVNKGIHWILIYFMNGEAEYFDPLGNEPDPLFLTFMKKHSRLISYNTVRVQSANSSSCGEYCIFFASMRSRNVSYNDILSYMGDEKVVIGYVNDIKHLN